MQPRIFTQLPTNSAGVVWTLEKFTSLDYICSFGMPCYIKHDDTWITQIRGVQYEDNLYSIFLLWQLSERL